MRIIFFGVPDLGLICFNTLITKTKNIIAVVPPIPSHPMHNLMVNTVKQFNIPVLFFNNSPEEQDFIEQFKNLKPDLAVVCAFNSKIPKELLDIPPMGFINCHPSLLPDYRGGNPYFHVIANGETKTGITIHYMDKNFDTGDIITQWKTDIMPNETLGILFQRTNIKTAEMISEIVEKLEKGETLPRTPQINKDCRHYSPNIYPEKGDTIIDWSKDAIDVERFIRACNPIYGASTFIRGCPVKIWSGQYQEKHNKDDIVGSIVSILENDVAIATGNGLFFPKVLQIGNFLITDVKDFVKRTNLKVGEIFTNKLTA